MMLLEQPTVVQRLDPLPDSISTRVVAAVPAIAVEDADLVVVQASPRAGRESAG